MSRDAWTFHLLFLVLVGLVLSLVLFSLFALLTVRKLWNNPQTRSRLGMSVLPGGALMNVAGAMTMPRAFTRWGRSGPVSDLFADCDALYAHTNLFDRCLGRACFVVLHVTAVVLAVLTAMRYLA